MNKREEGGNYLQNTVLQSYLHHVKCHYVPTILLWSGLVERNVKKKMRFPFTECKIGQTSLNKAGYLLDTIPLILLNLVNKDAAMF